MEAVDMDRMDEVNMSIFLDNGGWSRRQSLLVWRQSLLGWRLSIVGAIAQHCQWRAFC